MFNRNASLRYRARRGEDASPGQAFDCRRSLKLMDRASLPNSDAVRLSLHSELAIRGQRGHHKLSPSIEDMLIDGTEIVALVVSR